MKQAHIYFMIAVFSVVALSSCTIQNRVYRPGYHVEWHGGKKHLTPVQNEKTISVAEEVQLTEITTTEELPDAMPATIVPPVVEQMAEHQPAQDNPTPKNTIAPKPRVAAKQERKDDATSHAGHTLLTQPTATGAVLSMGEAGEGSSGALRTVGWVLIILGLLLLLLVSILSGILVMLLGLLFVIVGR
jgi:hypothetical protein